MNHSRTAAFDIDKSSVLCYSLDLAVIDLTNFQLHIYL